MSFNSDAMNTRLKLQGWYMDENVAAAIDCADGAADSANKKRGQLTKLSHELTLMCPIIHPLWCQAKWIPPLTSMSLEFLKNTSAFALLTNQVMQREKSIVPGRNRTPNLPINSRTR